MRWTRHLAPVLVALMLILTACSGGSAPGNPSGGEPPAGTAPDGGAQAGGQDTPQELEKVRIAISPFQDVYSFYVGIEKGWYKEAGIDLELVDVDWGGAQELLISGGVDLANTSDADLIIQNGQNQNTTMGLFLWFFQGHAVVIRNDAGFKTFDELLPEYGGDRLAATKAALMQLKGKNFCLQTSSAEAASMETFATYAGMQYPEDFKLINMQADEGLAAFLGGSCDGYIGGIPQRVRAVKEGHRILMDQSSLPETIVHAGFAVKNDWAEQHKDLLVRLQGVIFKQLDFIEKNPDEGLAIIAEHLNAKSGGQLTVADLKDIWNHIEFFPSSGEQFHQLALAEGGAHEWRPRFEAVQQQFIDNQTISGPVDLDSVYYVSEVVKEHMKTAEPEAYQRLYGG